MIYLGIGGEVEVSTRSLAAQERVTESQPRRRQIELQQIVLHLMPADHHGGSRICSAVQEPQAQNVVVYVHHGVGPRERPHRVLPLQHEVDVRHSRPNPRARDVAAVVAHLERCYGSSASDARGGLNERIRQCSVDGGLEKSVLIDGADFRAAIAVAVDVEESGVYRDRVVVDPDGIDFDEIFGGGLALRECAGRADGVDEQRCVGERHGGVEGLGNVEEVVGAVAKENDSVGISGGRQANSEFATETKSCGK